MHIPDGYLSPQTYIPLYGLSIVFWSTAIKKIKAYLSARYIPYLAMSAAFSFLIMMFNIPIPGGTTGHAVGAAVIAIILGPWTAVIAVSIVLIIQAVVFGDGGITAIGANCFNMAVIAPFVSYWIFRAVKGDHLDGLRIKIAAFLSGYGGLVAASLFAAIEFGIQPLIAAAPDGRAMYAPYPLSIAIPAMVGEHALVFGIVEGIVTLLAFNYFIKHEPELVYGLRG